MITRVASVVFFLAFGINEFWPFQHSAVVLGVAALVAGIAMALGV